MSRPRKGGRSAGRKGPPTSRERFYTHTEGHYVKTLSKRNLDNRTLVSPDNSTMTHVLTGKLDMCKNCQANMIPELRKKYPEHHHVVHYSFADDQQSKTLWKGEREQVAEYPGGTIIRHNMVPDYLKKHGHQ